MIDLLRGSERAVFCLLLGALALCASAQDFPSRPVQMVVPFAAGGGLDLNARNFGAALAEQLGQPVVVTNRDGAAGTIGLNAVASGQPDGYTLAFTPAVPLSSEPHRLKLAYGLDSFRPVCQVFDNIFAVAVPTDSPWRSMADLLAAARKDAGGVSYGTSGTGSIPHLGTADIEAVTHVSLAHVPYKGDAPMLQDLLAGRLGFGAVLVSSITGQLGSGALRLLAVYADRRHPAFANVPTLKESGVDVVQASFGGVLAPAGTPDAVVMRLEAACRKAVASPRYQDWARGANQVVDFRSGTAFDRQLREDSRLKAATLRRLGLAAR